MKINAERPERSRCYDNSFKLVQVNIGMQNYAGS